jgi:hypothetical protein
MFINGRFHVRKVQETQHELLHYQIVFSFREDDGSSVDSEPIVVSLFESQANDICHRLNKSMESNNGY